MDEGGYVQITDRLKDVIKSGGEWVSSLEMEDLISQLEAVSEVGVIGIPDDKWGERPFAVVVVKDEFRGKLTGDDIKDFLQQFVKSGRISKWAVPDSIRIVDEIPKTSVGKINKKEMRKEFAG
jgi:fatty-acyl-CoA synthase